MNFRALVGIFLYALISQSNAQPVVHIVVPFAAGGVQDIIARTIAPELSSLIGKTVVVENRTGAGGTIGNAYVAKAAPDGNTLLLSAASHTITGHVYPKLPYHPLNDFTAVAHIGTVDYVLIDQCGIAGEDRPPSSSPTPRPTRASSITRPRARAARRTCRWPTSPT